MMYLMPFRANNMVEKSQKASETSNVHEPPMVFN